MARAFHVRTSTTWMLVRHMWINTSTGWQEGKRLFRHTAGKWELIWDLIPPPKHPQPSFTLLPDPWVTNTVIGAYLESQYPWPDLRPTYTRELEFWRVGDPSAIETFTDIPPTQSTKLMDWLAFWGDGWKIGRGQYRCRCRFVNISGVAGEWSDWSPVIELREEDLPPGV